MPLGLMMCLTMQEGNRREIAGEGLTVSLKILLTVSFI